MEKTILLFSGGIDSLVAERKLTSQGIKPQTVYFNLNTPYSEKEIRVVRSIFPDTIIDLSLDLKDRQIGEKAYIPFRNLLLACQAVKYSDSIVIAGVKDDMVSDKNREIFREFSALLTKLENRVIRVWSPLWSYTKADAVKWYLEHGGSKEILLKTVSCYSHEEGNYCGKCPSCFRKWNALWENGIKLEFHNAPLMREYWDAAMRGMYIPERRESIIICVDQYQGVSSKPIEIIFDLDGTLTQESDGHGYDVYRSRTVVPGRVDTINTLYDAGHKITIYTSRHEEDRVVTEDWLHTNLISYHKLIMDKPKYDYFIDDRAFNPSSDTKIWQILKALVEVKK